LKTLAEFLLACGFLSQLPQVRITAPEFFQVKISDVGLLTNSKSTAHKKLNT